MGYETGTGMLQARGGWSDKNYGKHGAIDRSMVVWSSHKGGWSLIPVGKSAFCWNKRVFLGDHPRFLHINGQNPVLVGYIIRLWTGKINIVRFCLE